MAENFAERNQEKERKIPLFSVLKNNSILKNIFLTEAPSPNSPPSPNLSEEKKNHGFEETFVVGRHPDCNIKLEHPSISRFHLRIHYIPSLQSLSVFDLSSVHGTWVCGKRIEPEVEVKLQEGHTLQLGVSSRIYRLHWVPLSGIYDFNNPCLPTIDETEPLEEEEEEEEEEETHKVDGSLWGEHDLSLKLGNNTAESEGTKFLSSGYLVEDVREERHEGEKYLSHHDQSETMNDDLEGINLMFADMKMTLQSKTETPLSSFKLDCTQPPSLSQEEKVVKSSFKVELEDKKNEDCCAPRSMAADHDLEGLSFLFTEQSNQWTPSEYLMPDHEKSPLSYEEEKFDSSTYLQPVSPSAPLTPEGTVDHGGRASRHSANKLPRYCIFPEDAISPFHNGNEEENNNCLSSGTADTQTISEQAKQNTSLNASCGSGKSEPKSPCPSPWSRSGMSISKRRGQSDCVQIKENLTIGLTSDCEREDKTEESVFTPDKENCTPNFLRNRSLKKINQGKVKCELSVKSLTYSSDGENEEAFTPDKENISPATRLLRSMKKMGMDEVKPKTYRSSPLKNVDPNVHQVVGQCSSGKEIELRKLLHGKNTARSACRSNKKIEPEANVSKGSPDKEAPPFQILIMNSGSRNSDASNIDATTRSCSPMKNPNVNKATYHFNAFEEKNKKWTMVVDTACLLDKESRKALQLMQGFPRTNMVIPSMVIKELDFLKRHGSLFRSTKQASDALQWIEDCMVNGQAWIHVQSAMEDTRQIAPTPTASSFSCFSVDKMKLLVAGFLPFYHWENLSEIVSPTTEDRILECAIWLRRMGDNGQVVLLSDNISLKIKAMAEGLLCETAEQFRQSLVNPFSERFFWTHSSPRGLTWSCVDDIVLKNKYYNGSSKKQSKSGEESAKGLKLVLLYNSQLKPISSVN